MEIARRTSVCTMQIGGFSAFMSEFETSRPFKTYKEQKEILVERGIIIDDEELLRISLQNYSYYTIVNGYKDLFIDSKLSTDSNELFENGTTFSMLYEAHWMDITITNLLFKYTLLVEKKLKTRISYIIAETYGENEVVYLDESNYSQAPHHKGKINSVKKAINENRFRDISAKHYMSKERNLPPWIAVKAVSFGVTFIWYQALNNDHKLKLVKEFLHVSQYNNKEEFMSFFFRLVGQVYEFRNRSAHGNRTFLLKLPPKYSFKAKHIKAAGISNLYHPYNYNYKDTLYSVIISILILIDDPYAKNNFLIELQYYFDIYSQPQYNFNGKDVYDLFELPKDAIERITNNFFVSE